jgi:hypothetical protein
MIGRSLIPCLNSHTRKAARSSDFVRVSEGSRRTIRLGVDLRSLFRRVLGIGLLGEEDTE